MGPCSLILAGDVAYIEALLQGGVTAALPPTRARYLPLSLANATPLKDLLDLGRREEAEKGRVAASGWCVVWL